MDWSSSIVFSMAAMVFLEVVDGGFDLIGAGFVFVGQFVGKWVTDLFCLVVELFKCWGE